MAERATKSNAEHDRAESRRRVLQVVRGSTGGCSVRQIAERTGLHPNTVRFHLERLQDDRLVSRQAQRSAGPGRPPLRYTANPLPESEGERREFAPLADVLAELVTRISARPAVAAIEAGRAWELIHEREGADSEDPSEAIGELVALLTEQGFASEASAESEDGGTIVLHRHCPFLEVAQGHQDVVCSLHLGLMRGTLERMNAPVTVERLTPFASPAGCEALLLRSGRQ